jgi:molecular chaperone GrpE
MPDYKNDPHPLETPVSEEETGNTPSVSEELPTDSLEKEITLLKDQLLRALAETENLRKRSERDKEEINKYALSKFARDLLSVADTFSAALQSLPSSLDASLQSFVDGIHLAEKELLNIFERYGIQKISPLHQPFDPNFHQAMAEAEVEGAAPQTVVQVLQVGYSIHDRLLRPALVMVSK